MSEFRIQIDTDDTEGAPDELVRILRNVIQRVQAGEVEGGLRDNHGNDVGAFYLVREEAKT